MTNLGLTYRTREIKIKKKGTNYWIYYENAEAAARDLGLDKSALSRVLRGERKSVNGYIADYVVQNEAIQEQLLNAYNAINENERYISGHEGRLEMWTRYLETVKEDARRTAISFNEKNIEDFVENNRNTLSAKKYVAAEEKKIAEAKALIEANKAKIAEINRITGRETIIQESAKHLEIDKQLAALEQIDAAANKRIAAQIRECREICERELKKLYELEDLQGLSVDQLLRKQRYLELRNQIDNELKKLGEGLIETVGSTITDAATLVNPNFSIEQLKAFTDIDYGGIPFSQRIWGNLTELREQVYEKIEHSVVLGYSYKDAARELAERFNVSENRARCLTRTETARAYNKATIQNYKDNGITQVEVYTEPNCCDDCAALKGKVFTPEEATDLLPRHPSCKCCWLPIVKKR